MDLYNLFCAVILIYIVLCLTVIFYGDSDILTFVYEKLGKDPETLLQGKAVWILGASSGIGEGIAKALARSENVTIALSGRQTDKLNRVRRECLEKNNHMKPEAILVVPFDMTEYSSHAVCLDQVLAKFGKLDILISNAGVSQRANWDEIEIDVDKQLFDINVFSLIHLNRLVIKYFKQENVKDGQLVVTSSLAGKIGTPNSSSYSASKFAIHGYFESLRNESRDTNLAITILCPGPIVSNVGKASLTARAGQITGGIVNPKSRFGKKMSAERCAKLILVAIANKLEESWISLLPNIPIAYLASYQPYLFSRLLAFFGNHMYKK